MSQRCFIVRHLKDGVETETYATGPTWYLVVEQARAIFGSGYLDVSEELSSVDESLITLRWGVERG